MDSRDVSRLISREELVQLLRELVCRATENPPGCETPAARVIEDVARREGLRCELDEYAPDRTNVYLTLGEPRPGPRLLLTGHTDVVPAGEGWTHDPYSPSVQDGRLYGRGACDMKAGVAAMIGAAIALKRAELSLHGFLMVALVADEEEHQSGTRRLVERHPDFNFAVVGEPTRLAPVTAHKGNMYFRVTARGRAAHASVPHLGVNAIEEMSKLIARADDYRKRIARESDEFLGSPTLSTGLIHGGSSACIVADTCEAVFDRRIVPSESPDAVWAGVNEFVSSLAGESPADFTVERLWVAPGLSTPSSARIVQAVLKACAEVRGVTPAVEPWPAVADSGILSACGIETVLFGPGDILVAHKPDEYVILDDLIAAHRAYCAVAMSLLEAEEE